MPVVKTLPRHKKNPDVGTKETVYWNEILIEQEDAQSFADNEEVSSDANAHDNLCLTQF